MSPHRRRVVSAIAGAAAYAWLPRTTAAQQEVEPFATLLKKIAGDVSVRPGRVKLDIPLLADNGHSVPLRIRIDSPMSATDRVRSVHVLSEKNPRPVIATFQFGALAGRAEIHTRVRLNGHQRLLVVAGMSDGTYWSGDAEVIVTETACLDQT